MFTASIRTVHTCSASLGLICSNCIIQDILPCRVVILLSLPQALPSRNILTKFNKFIFSPTRFPCTMYPLHSFLSLLFLLIPTSNLANADLKFTSPISSSSVKGGVALTVSWREDGSTLPKLSQYDCYTLDLCTGSNTKHANHPPYIPSSLILVSAGLALYRLLFLLGLAGLLVVQKFSTPPNSPQHPMVSTRHSLLILIILTHSFLRMTLTIDSPSLQDPTTHFTPRFSLTSMTGLFPPSIPSSILTSLAGTPPPGTVKNLVYISDTNPGKMGPDIPYPLQTGRVRYAPMQRQPGRSITASPTPAGESEAERGGWGFTSRGGRRRGRRRRRR